MRSGRVIGGVALAAFLSLPVAVSLPAQAADMAVGPRPVAPAPSTYIPAYFTWTGFYVGIEAGYGWGTAPWVMDPFFGKTSPSIAPSIKGFVTGGVTGINYQVGWAVIGLEGDFVGSWVKGSINDTTTTNLLQSSVYWTASLTPRFGVAFDRLLVYAKGGGAFAFDKAMETINNGGAATGSSAGGSTTRGGWTVGGGIEYAMTEHWTTRVEYDYFGFSTKGYILSGPSANQSANVGIKLNEIKAGVGYKF
jgi:outer membrane immunogenic protein